MAKKKRTRANNPAPSTGFIQFMQAPGQRQMTCLLGDGPATVSGGYGGWTARARSRRRAFTIWEGNDPLAIDIPILIDHWGEDSPGIDGEQEVRALEYMAGLESAGKTDEPPLITFQAGGAVPHDYTHDPNRDWVIQEIQWGDVIRTAYGNRARQAAVIKVLEFIEDDNLSNVSAAQRRKGQKKRKDPEGKPGASHKQYVVKTGDTLHKIAAKQLGDAKRWHEIADLNGIRDGAKLKRGQVLRLP